MINAILFLVVFAAIQLFVPYAISEAYTLVAGHQPAQSTALMIISLSASSVATIAVFLWLRWAEVSRRYVQSRPWAALSWCAFAAIGAIIPSTWLQEMLPELPNVTEQEFDQILRNRWGYYAVGLLAPVCEELVFRGAILRSLLRWFSSRSSSCEASVKFKSAGHWSAISISAVLFAVAHFNPAQMPHALVVGLLLGWMYYRTGSVVPGVVYHWVNNSAAYVIYNLYPNADIRLVDIFGSQRTVAAAVLFSLFILVPAIYQLSLRLKRGVPAENL